MISAGNTNQQAPTMGIGYTPLQWNYGGNTSTDVSLNLSEAASAKYLDNMQKDKNFNRWVAAGTQIHNGVMQALTTSLNYALQSKFLGLQDTIANNQLDLGMRGMDIEEQKVAAQERIAKEQSRMGQRIARIQSQTQIAIANIERKGKTERAKLFTGLNAFKRNNYSTGRPTFQTSVLS